MRKENVEYMEKAYKEKDIFEEMGIGFWDSHDDMSDK